MLLARAASRSRSLGRVRAPLLGFGGCNDDIAAWATLLYRKAGGGVSGKRRSKYKGQYKASAATQSIQLQRYSTYDTLLGACCHGMPYQLPPVRCPRTLLWCGTCVLILGVYICKPCTFYDDTAVRRSLLFVPRAAVYTT